MWGACVYDNPKIIIDYSLILYIYIYDSTCCHWAANPATLPHLLSHPPFKIMPVEVLCGQCLAVLAVNLAQPLIQHTSPRVSAPTSEQSGESPLKNVGRAAEPHPHESSQGSLRAEIPTLAPVARSNVAATQSLSHNRHIHRSKVKRKSRPSASSGSGNSCQGAAI